jgi:hypothetical protein
MDYNQFICKDLNSDFIISEEDKTSEKSIRFWFNILDIDHNGILS